MVLIRLALSASLVLFTSLAAKRHLATECHTTGWFGSACRYQCHCAELSPCNSTSGDCQNGCHQQFFGPACQYESSPYTPVKSGLSWLADNDDGTCNQQLVESSISVRLVTPHRLTWVRVVVSKPDLLHEVHVSYVGERSDGLERACVVNATAIVDSRTVDITCDTQEPVRIVVLNGTGVNFLCSLHISGGRNVAVKQNTVQSSVVGSFTSVHGVDGDVGTDYQPSPTYRTSSQTCTHTSNTSHEWWEVTLGQPKNIDTIRVYNRPDCCGERLRGFSLLARDSSNSTVFSYTDTSAVSQPVYTIVPSSRIVRPVRTIQINKRISSFALTLCEVMALGESACPPGLFGLECDRQCNCASQEVACLVSTGGCPSGCAAGYTGEDCWTVCSAGMFGVDCQENCDLHCSGVNNDCHHVTGSCLVSCDPGYKPFPQCSQECESGTYGEDCGYTCSTRCLHNECDHVTGVCKQCGPGNTGILCDEECPVGFHGPGCSIPCNQFCAGTHNECDPVDGSCETACDAGYYPFPFCTDECPVTTYGVGCIEMCSSNCLNRDCHHVTGKCIQCAAGHTGEACDEICPPGRHGPECLEHCSVQCAGEDKPCNHITGLCELGCLPGYQPSSGCTEKCLRGTFGLNCEKSCSATCRSNECDHATGTCHQCVPGYVGGFCNQECPSHTYGTNCGNTCSTDCLDSMCNHVTGICHECVQGQTGDYCATPYSESSRQPDANLAAIGVAVGAGAVLLVLVIVLVLLLLRGRRKQKPRDAQPVLAQGAKNEDPELTQESSGIPHVLYRSGRTSGSANGQKQTEQSTGSVTSDLPPENTSVRVEDLKTYLQQHGTDSFLKEQFQAMPMTTNSAQTQGLTSRNVKKNRYKNIVPYDHSRVLLQADPARKHEDYFNASFVKGYKSQQTFIASQAPNDLILPDFVRMLWEQRVVRVVMLTNLVELSKIKCTQYWPKEGEAQFGEITIRLLTTIVFAEYTIRRFRFSKSGETARDVTQFHFTAWPDKSVPDSPWGLVDFYHRVSATPGSGPLLVHCSAGVGRTGTFIALCHLLQEAEETGKMDFLSTLWRLRQDRMSMIQTVDQYVFLHRAALVGHVTASKSFQVKVMSERHDAMQGETADVSAVYKEEFQALALACSIDVTASTNDVGEGQSAYNSARVNCEETKLCPLLPKEHHRPKLKSDHKSDHRGDHKRANYHLNAVLVPSLVKTRQNILTQLPLPSTVTDFWRLVTQYRVGLIVAFHTDCSRSDQSVGRFLPESAAAPLQDDLFEVKADVEADTSLCQTLSVSVQRHARKSSQASS
ncbi:hypothetical protein RRG08_063602, partial [Elysia crispata]